MLFRSLRESRIGLAQNRLPANSVIEDVRAEDVMDTTGSGWSSPRGAAGSGSGAAVPAATSPLAVPAGVSPFTPFDKTRTAAIHTRRMPHWTQEGCTYFVTFRLSDSIPVPRLHELQRERNEWLKQKGGTLPPERESELHEFYRAKLEEALDENLGSCVLNDAALSSKVESALKHFDGERYRLGHYVVMPNHVHALVRPIQGHTLSEILHSWKSFTANQSPH